MAKKLMALILAVLMAVSLLPAAALADGETVITDLTAVTKAGSYVMDKTKEKIVLTAPLEISSDITLELSGQTITLSDGSEAEAVFDIKEGGKLTLKGEGTIEVPENASGILLSGSKGELTIQDDISISGGSFGVKASAGTENVKVSVNTFGEISSDIAMTLGKAELKITAGTLRGKEDKGGALVSECYLSDIISSESNEKILLRINGSDATAEQLDEKATPNMTVLAFDNAKAPVLSDLTAVRTSESEGSVTFTSSKSGTVYYQAGGENPAATDLISAGTKAELKRGENTIALSGLGTDAQTVYITTVSSFDVRSTEVSSVSVPAVLAAPTGLSWNGAAAAWTAAEGAAGYNVQLYLNGAAYNSAFKVDGTQTADLTNTMADDGSYTFKVQAVGSNTVGAWSEMSETAYTVDKTAPVLSETSGIRTDASSGSVSFKSSEAGTVYYIVGVDTPDKDTVLNTGKTADLAADSNTIELSGFESAGAVNVYLVAKDKQENAGEVLTVTVPKYLAAPTSPVWENTTAKWTGTDGADSYTVQLYKDGTEDANLIDTENITECSYAFTLDSTGTYYFKVQAVSGDIIGAWSEMSAGAAVDKTAPSISDQKGTRTDASSGSVSFKSDEAGTVYYIVGGDTPDKETVLASDKSAALAAGDNKIDLSGLSGVSAVNVYLAAKDVQGNAGDVITVTVPVYLNAPTAATWVDASTTAMWSAVEGAEAYNIQLLKDGSDFGNVIVVSGGSTTTADLASSMTKDGTYTFKVQATADNAQSGWSSVSSGSYKRDTVPPTIKSDPSKRISEKEADIYFTSSEDGTYYYMVGKTTDAAPTVDQIVSDSNQHGGCTNAKTTIRIKDIADKEARNVYVVVCDKSGNRSDMFTINILAYSAAPTPTPTAAPTATPTATPAATYTVTLQGGTGYSIAATGGSKSPVTTGGSFSFTVTPSTGYTRGSGFSVKANGVAMTARNGVYTISNIKSNQTVSVAGIVKSSSGGGTTTATAPTITSTTLKSATVGTEYRQQLTASGTTPITWSYSGTLPSGLTLAASTGILSGTPTQEGSFRFTVKATNSAGSSTRQLTLVISGSEYTVTSGANSEWTQGTEDGLSFTGSGKGTFTVKMDGSNVASDKYTVSSDGKTLTLKSEYLDTLSSGSHTVTLVYSDGSAKAKFTVKAADKKAIPTVSAQPQNSEAAADSSVTFSVTASGTTPLTCQWQVDKNDGKGWTDISGASSAKYTVQKVAAEQNGWKYRCVISNSAGSVESNAATLTVKEALDVPTDDAESTSSGSSLGRVLLIAGGVVVAAGLGVGLYFYFRRRNKSGYDE